MALIVSDKVLVKLKEKHGVSRREVEQCFDNREGGLLEDSREKHKTSPPTRWFIAPTNRGRLLKIVIVAYCGNVYLKSAYEPNKAEIGIYERHGAS